jgi:hypothetical protein
MKTFIHHKIPQSRGGGNEDWNLVQLSAYEHAYEHALDFVLFSSSPSFDCRQSGWKLLPKDLQKAVRTEISNRMKGNTYAKGHGESKRGEKNGMWGRKGELHHGYGRLRPEEERKRISRANKGKPKTPEHCRKISKAHLGKKMSEEFKIKRSKDATGRFWVTDPDGYGRMLKGGTPLPPGYVLGRPKSR